MALDFSKDLANYADFGSGEFNLHDVFDGASGATISYAIKVDFLTGGGLNDDHVYIWIDNTSFFIRCLFNGSRIQCNLKPTPSESSEDQLSRSGVDISDGNWHFQCFGFSLPDDEGASFTDGSGSQGANLFTATSIVMDTSTNNDSIGSKLTTGAPADTGDQLDGQMAHFALWPLYLSRQEMESLSAGYSPLLIRPQDIAMYLPLDSDLLDARDGSDQGLTITGSVPFVDGPPLFQPPSSPSLS